MGTYSWRDIWLGRETFRDIFLGQNILGLIEARSGGVKVGIAYMSVEPDAEKVGRTKIRS